MGNNFNIGRWDISISHGLVALIVSFLCTFPYGASAAYRLPDTGQTKCYRTLDAYHNYEEIPCAGTGQDGEYSINPLSYHDNENGTVTDINTGLMWQRCSVGRNNDATCSGTAATYNWYQASGTYDAANNPSSLDVCKSLTLAGYTDWRLPAENELDSIVDYSAAFPSINATYFPNTEESKYWSQTLLVTTTAPPWQVNFQYGTFSVSAAKNTSWYVRCVRGGQGPAQSLADNGNGTVIDHATGLVWQSGEPGYMYWNDALTYCKTLSLLEHTDWRLPSVRELLSLTDHTRYNPAINTTFFPGVPTSYIPRYWSSTSWAYGPNAAWYLDFYYGDAGGDYKIGGGFVRCVRGGIPIPPTVTTAAVAAITNTSATSGGNAATDGEAVTARGVCWGTSANPTTSDSKSSDGAGTGPFTSQITGLSALTAYHVRAYAVNSAGTAYGEDISFMTNLCTADVQRGGTSYPTIQGAVTGGSGAEIRAVARVFPENIIFANGSALTLAGGYACGFGSTTGVTTIHGSMTFAGSGAVVLGRVAVY